MKKFLTVVLAALIALSFFAVPSFADEETAAIGDGFDFYSMTAYYEEPVVLSYKYVTKADNIQKMDIFGNPIFKENGDPELVDKGWIFADPADSYVVPAIAFTSKDGTFTNFAPGYGEKEKGKGKFDELFYCVNAPSLGINSSAIAMTDTYGLTYIGDNTAISIKNAAKLYGATELYDDAGTPNPNFTRVDGYFLDKEVDADGDNLRIDINGYVIDKNYIWHSRDGHRIEPFVEIGEDEDKLPILVWIPISSRLDENGRVRDYTTITNEELLLKGVLTVPEKYAILTPAFDATVDYDENGEVNAEDEKYFKEHIKDYVAEMDAEYDYDGNGKIEARKDKSAYNSLVKSRKQWFESYSISMYTIDYADFDGDGKKTEKDNVVFIDKNKNGIFDEGDIPAYNSPDRVITRDDIMKRTDALGNVMYVQGSPAIGDPLTKVAIKKLTVEIDALGTQLYSDVSADPQQQNEIIITTGDLYRNVKAALDYVAEHPEKEYTEGMIIGTAKSVTTKTEVVSGGGNYPETVKSVEVELAEGVVIPENATLYFNFVVKTQQPENQKSFLKKKDYNLLSINKSAIDLEAMKDKETPTPGPKTVTVKSGCGGMITGSFMVCAAMAVAFIVLKKKEK